MWTLLLIALSYCIGSIPTSIITGKLMRGIDVREHGSRNPGATNTFRVLGWKIGVFVGLIDIFKGYACVMFLTAFVPTDAWASPEVGSILAGLAAVSGHVWTVFAGFKGGKGVGTAFGVFLGLTPVPSLIAAAVWAAFTFGTGYVSVGSITAAVALPVSIIAEGLLRDRFSVVLSALSVIIGLVVIIRHRSNIRRLMRGEENRFGIRGKQ